MLSIKKIQQYEVKSEKFSFYKPKPPFYSWLAVAKSAAEPGNSNDLQLADNSAPCAFFVRSTRTPKEKTFPKNGERGFLSMVACNGKGSPFAVFQLSQFSSPLHVTARTLESLAVASQKLQLELSKMIYLFLGIPRHSYNLKDRQMLRIEAANRTQARAQLARDYVLIPCGQIAKSRPNYPGCLTKSEVAYV